MEIKIKEQYRNCVIGFNGSAIPLGLRSQGDLVDLALLAISANHHTEKFEVLPSLADLRRMKMAALEIPMKTERENAHTKTSTPPSIQQEHQSSQ